MMIKIPYMVILFIYIILGLVSCRLASEPSVQWTKDFGIELLDTLQRERDHLLAGYNEAEGSIVFIKNDNPDDLVIKYTIIKGYPKIIDSLIVLKNGEMKSMRNPFSYKINNEEVIVTCYQKIIHPSSNWQGQSPWQETIVTRYQRADLELK